jgi:AcrR family transcriptional regulator
MAEEQDYVSVWARDAARASGERGGLSRARIVRAAIELLDAEGLTALSMRRLATRLGSGATSIYWHVANKEELLELVMDEVLGEMAASGERGGGGGDDGWRNTVTAYAYGLRYAILRHPWLGRLLGTRPAIGPNALMLAERQAAAFQRAGFRGAEIDFAASVVGSFVIGATATTVNWQGELARSGKDQRDWTNALHRVLNAADHPTLTSMYAHWSTPRPTRPRGEIAFDFGLLCVLDGLEARLRADDPRHEAAARSHAEQERTGER